MDRRRRHDPGPARPRHAASQGHRRGGRRARNEGRHVQRRAGPAPWHLRPESGRPAPDRPARGPPRGRQAGLLPGGRDQRPRPVQDHGPGPAPGRRRRRPDPGQAQGGRPELPARDPPAVHPAGAGCRRHRGSGRAGRRPSADERRQRRRRPVRPLRCPRQRAPLLTFHVHDQRPRRELREDERRRVLRRLEAWLLRALRHVDDGPSPRAQHPGPVRRGLPAGHARQADRRRAGVQLERPRLGRGLLPGLRLVHVRPDRERPGRDRSAAQRQAGGQRPAEPVPEPRVPTDVRRRRAAVAAQGPARPARPAPDGGGRAGWLHPHRGRAVRDDGAARLPRLAARSARPGDAREARGPASAGSRRASASGRDRRRPPTSTRRPSARSCPASGPSCRRSRPRRSRSPTAAGSSATTGSRRSATSYAKLRVGLLRLLFRRGDRKRLKR